MNIDKKEKLLKKWLKAAKFTAFNSWFVIIVLFLYGVVSPGMHLSLTGNGAGFALLVLIAILVSFVPFLISVNYKKKQTLREIEDGSIYIIPPHKLVEPIESALIEFNIKTKFKGDINILVAKRDPTVNAMVVSDKTKNYLLLSLGFFSFFKSNPNLALAILAHEYSHIFRGDSRRWVGLSIASTFSKKWWLPIASVLMVIAILTLRGGMVAFFNFALAFFVSSVIISFFIPIHRKGNEVAADLGAMLLTSSEDLINALEAIGIDSNGHTDVFNPSKEWRIKKIRTLTLRHSYL